MASSIPAMNVAQQGHIAMPKCRMPRATCRPNRIECKPDSSASGFLSLSVKGDVITPTLVIMTECGTEKALGTERHQGLRHHHRCCFL